MTMPYAPTASSWVELLTPTQCPCCGQAVMPTPQDYLDAFTTSMDAFTSSMSQWMAGAGGATTGAPGSAGVWGIPQPRTRPGSAGYGGGWQPSAGQSGRRHMRGHQHHAGCGCGSKQGRGCRQCQAGDCHCQCCIGGDLDLVVYSRLGERRIIPITITNERRREREVTLALSSFTTKGGSQVPVTGAIVGETTFTLAPCEERAVIIEVASAATPSQEGANATDVDDCIVAVADLTVTGCDIRCPIGIGVALLPRDCDTFDLSCGCGCC
jgi:hypothetical protein